MFLSWLFSFLLALMPHVSTARAAATNMSSLPAASSSPQALATSTIPQVPLYSQFKDIASPTWQKVGCGITDLAMIINYYKPNTTTVNSLLKQGITAGAYSSAGWIYAGLIDVSKTYGFTGESYNFQGMSDAKALAALKTQLADGPVIISVHYQFNPKSTIPHLVVLDGFKEGTFYYNDPAAKGAGRRVSTANFLRAWKKRTIVIRPATSTTALR